MSFPTSPTNNQTTVVNGITFIYSSSKNTWTRQAAPGVSGPTGPQGPSGSLGPTGPTGPASSLAASTYVVAAGLSADQSIPSTSDTLIAFVDISDTQNWWDPTNKRFQPTIAGWYEISVQVLFATGSTTANQYNTQMRKNGSQLTIWQNQITTSVGVSQGGTRTIYLNGTTDYVDVTVYNGNSGSVGIIKGSSDSSGTFFNAHLIAYGADGARGPTGPQGASGPQGPQGVSGPTGPQGPQGVSGPTGPQGAQGVSGPTGPQGAQGVSGPTGPQGAQGVSGPTGPTGVGYDGVTSTTSATPAASGTITLTTNKQGAFATGSRVRAVNTTVNFFEGVVTITGATSFAIVADYNVGTTLASSWTIIDVGSRGPTGPQGPSGPQGPQGVSGPTGPQGPQGLQGVSGPTGPQGPQGVSGPQGPQGVSGPTGPQGPQGVSGPQGPQGVSGPTGPTGPVAGTTTQVAYNNAGSAAGAAGLLYITGRAETQLTGYAVAVNARGSITGAQTIDLSLGCYVTATATGAITWTVTNLTGASTYSKGFVLVLTNGGAGTQTWMTGIKWPGGSAPTLQAAGVDVLTFFTPDNGTTWRGVLSMGASA